MHPSDPTGSVVNLSGLTGLEKAVCKSRLGHLQLCFYHLWIVLECGYNEIDISYCDNTVGFCKSGHIHPVCIQYSLFLLWFITRLSDTIYSAPQFKHSYACPGTVTREICNRTRKFLASTRSMYVMHLILVTSCTHVKCAKV